MPPLLPIPEDNTARLWVSYIGYGLRHEVQLRPLTAFTIEDTVTWFRSFLTSNSDLFANSTVFDSAQVAEINSNVRNPIEWATITGTGAVDSSVDKQARFIAFSGRASTGRKSKLTFYGSSFGPDANFRIPATDSAIIDDAIAFLNSLAARAADITGAKLTWKPYANAGVNAYWQRQLRVG